jgi:molybdenum cofactor biosynthesis protein B
MPLNIQVITVSDTRTEATDTSGAYLAEAAAAAGHRITARHLVKDDVYQIRKYVSDAIADENTDVVLLTGGTGFSGRDSTPEAVLPLLDKQVEGFGELFRQLSYEEIGTSTIQSRALGGLANQTLIFCLPGSTGACRTAWTRILAEQLDGAHRPCNFVTILKGAPHSSKAG